MSIDLIAFLDESMKPARDRKTRKVANAGDHYVVAAAIAIEGDRDSLRDELADVEEHLGYPLHYTDLRSSRRRCQAVAALDTIQGWDGYLFETAKPMSRRHHSEHHIRATILKAAFTYISVEISASRIVLETRDHPSGGHNQLDKKDHQVLQKLLSQKIVPGELRIGHEDKSEKLLAISDVLAGARTDDLCGVDCKPYALINHRVRRVVTVFDRSS